MWGADETTPTAMPSQPTASPGIDLRHHFDILTNVETTVEASAGAKTGECQVFLFDEKRVHRARRALLAGSTAQDAAELFKLLAHPTRLQILRALAREELCVCDLAQVLGLSVSATSYQLQAMRRARVVRYRTEGKLAYYRVANDFVLALLEDGLRHLDEGPAR